MSFADDIRKNYVEKPTNTPDPDHLYKLAKKAYDRYKEELKARANSGAAEEIYTGIGLRKRKCVSVSAGIDIAPNSFKTSSGSKTGYHMMEQSFEGCTGGFYAYDKRAVKKFYNILKEMAVQDGISTELEHIDSDKILTDYKIHLRIFL